MSSPQPFTCCHPVREKWSKHGIQNKCINHHKRVIYLFRLLWFVCLNFNLLEYYRRLPLDSSAKTMLITVKIKLFWSMSITFPFSNHVWSLCHCNCCWFNDKSYLLTFYSIYYNWHSIRILIQNFVFLLFLPPTWFISSCMFWFVCHEFSLFLFDNTSLEKLFPHCISIIIVFRSALSGSSQRRVHASVVLPYHIPIPLSLSFEEELGRLWRAKL